MRRCALLVVLFAAAARPAPDFGESLARFHLHYNRFMRLYLGCPKGAVEIEQCNPKQGLMDYSEFQRAAKEARTLFNLHQ